MQIEFAKQHSQPAKGRRFSSLIAAEGRFAKRPSAAMSEEKRSAVRRLQHSRLNGS